MNLNYADTILLELEKLLKARFISSINAELRFLSMVIISKKNKKLQICIDFCKLNIAI